MPQPPCSWKFDYNFTVSLLCQFVRLNCWDWCYLQIGSIWTELNPQTSCWYPRIAYGCGETVPLTPLPPPVGWNCVPDPIIRPAYFICCFWWWRWFSCKVISNSWDPMDCSLPGSSVYGVSQARMLEWVAISFSRGSSQPRDWTWVAYIAGGFITGWVTRKTCTQFKIIFKQTLIFSLIYELFRSMSFSFQTLGHFKISSCY